MGKCYSNNFKMITFFLKMLKNIYNTLGYKLNNNILNQIAA